jgi:hypothetical protein
MSQLSRALLAALLAGAAAGLLACGSAEAPAPQADPVSLAAGDGWLIDTVGVRDISEGDTLNLDENLTIIETTRIFPREADEGEVFAWEFEAREMTPVKLLIVHAQDRAQTFELLGESPMVVPRRLGPNRFELPEPIPLKYPSLVGLYMPEKGAVPFRKVPNWKTLITAQPFERPFIDRTPFSMYGWRYGVRVFWRRPGGPDDAGDAVNIDAVNIDAVNIDAVSTDTVRTDTTATEVEETL